MADNDKETKLSAVEAGEDVHLLQTDPGHNNNLKPLHPDTTCTVNIIRPAYNQGDIDKTFGRIEPVNVPIATRIANKTKSACSCSGACLMNRLLAWLPFIAIMRKYDWRNWIVSDMVAGLCVGVIHIPQSMGFSILTALPPIYGLYSTIYPIFLYFIFGTSRHISVGTMAVISLMIGAVVEREAALFTPSTPINDVTNITEVVVHINGSLGNETGYGLPATTTLPADYLKEMEAFRVDIATSVTLLVGLIQLVMYLLNLGAVAKLMPMSFIGGFMTGAAFHIVTSQIPFMLGVTPPRQTGMFRLPKTWYHILLLIPQAHPAEVIISIICICVLLILKEGINERYKEKLKVPIPAELIVVGFAIVISYFAKLNDRFDVRIIANVPTGLPAPKVPSLYHGPSYIADAFAIALVSYAVSISLAKSFAIRFQYKLDQNQDMLAYGLMHTISSFFSCFGGAQAPPRSLVQVNTGGKTQVASLVSGAMVLLVCIFLGPAIEPLPNSVLGAVIAVALTPLFKSFQDLPGFYRVNRQDFIIWVMTFLAVVILQVDVGLYVGVLTGLATVVAQTISASYTHLTQASNTELYLPKDKFGLLENKIARCIKIFRFESPLYYANVDRFKSQVQLCANELLESASRGSYIGLNDNIEKDISGLQDTKAIILDCSCLFYIDLMGLNALKHILASYKDLDIKLLFAHCPDSLVAKMAASGMQVDQLIYPSVHDAVCVLTQHIHSSSA